MLAKEQYNIHTFTYQKELLIILFHLFLNRQKPSLHS